MPAVNEKSRPNIMRASKPDIIQLSPSLYSPSAGIQFLLLIGIWQVFEQHRGAFRLTLNPQRGRRALWIWLWKFSYCQLCGVDGFPNLHQVYLDPRLEHWSLNVTPFGCVVANYGLIYDTKSVGYESFVVMQKIPRACDETSVIPSLQVSPSSVSTVDEDQFIPAAWIRAARWSACASAPPSCPCSSDSLSSAAECPPVSDTLGTHPLTSAQTKNKVSITWRLM